MNQSKKAPEAACSAIEENLFSYIRMITNNTGNEFSENEKSIWFSAGFKAPSMLSACVYNYRDSGKEVITAVKDQLQIFKDRSVPVLWTTGPSSPGHLNGSLKKAGMMHVQTQAGMALDLSQLEENFTPADVQLREVTDKGDLLEWFKLFNLSFEQAPGLNRLMIERYGEVFLNRDLPLRHYLAFYKGRPAATASYFSEKGVTGIYNIVTAPEARKGGLGEYMTRHALLEGKKLGDKMGILQASPSGEPVYHRIGFQKYCTLDMFIKMYGSSMLTIPLNLLRVKLSNTMRKIFR